MSSILQRATPDTERSVVSPFSGSSQNIGSPLAFNPVHIVLDNQSTVSAALYINGILWKTFAAGQALIMDMRANHGIADNFSFNVNDQFSLIGDSSGAATGSFRISILYAS